MCEKCEDKKKGPGELPSLELKALGLYPSDRSTVVGVKSLMTVTAAGSNTDIGSVDIVEPILNPTNLHRLPGLAINAYPIVKDVSIVARVTAGTLVTPFSFVGFLLYVDPSTRRHVVGSLAMSVPTALAPTDSSFNAVHTSFPNIIMPSTVIGEAPLKTFGSWVLDGTLVLGTATTIVFDIFANLGVLYGSPR